MEVRFAVRGDVFRVAACGWTGRAGRRSMRAVTVGIALGLAVAAKSMADERPQAGGPAAELTGVGIGLKATGTEFAIFLVLPNTPAALSEEVHVNDKVVAVGQGDEQPVDVEGMSLAEVVDLVRGPVGTEVRLTIVPANDQIVKQKVVSLFREKLQGGRITGKKAPSARARRLSDGSPWAIEEHLGQVVVVDFWATWCLPCMEHVQKMQDYPELHSDWGDDVALVAVNVDDDLQSAKKVVTEKEWNRTINLWGDKEFRKAFDSEIIPMVVIVDQGGKVIAAGSPRSIDVPRVVDRLLRARRERTDTPGSDRAPGGRPSSAP